MRTYAHISTIYPWNNNFMTLGFVNYKTLNIFTMFSLMKTPYIPRRLIQKLKVTLGRRGRLVMMKLRWTPKKASSSPPTTRV
jgi:hypothetical protein